MLTSVTKLRSGDKGLTKNLKDRSWDFKNTSNLVIKILSRSELRIFNAMNVIVNINFIV